MNRKLWIAQQMIWNNETNRFDYTNDIEVLTNKKALEALIENRTTTTPALKDSITNLVRDQTSPEYFTISFNYHWYSNGEPRTTKCRMIFRYIKTNQI